MPECDQRPAIHRLEPVLDVRDDRHGPEERTGDLEQRWSLDRLHEAPEMTVVAAEIAEPPATRPRLEHHRHRDSSDSLVAGSHLLEQRLERRLERCVDLDLL